MSFRNCLHRYVVRAWLAYTPEFQPLLVALSSPVPLTVSLWLITAAHTRALRRVALMSNAPGAVVAVGDGDESPVGLLRDRPLRNGKAAAYVCRQFTCAAPTSEPRALAAEVGSRLG